MIEKPEESQVVKENCISMVQCKVMKQLEFLEQRKFEDEDIQSDIEFLKEKMEISLQDLSSYDEYVTEVRSGRLEWSPGRVILLEIFPNYGPKLPQKFSKVEI